MQRRQVVPLAAGGVLVLVVVVALWVWPGFLHHRHTSTARPVATASAAPSGSPEYLPGGPLPAPALATATMLVTGTVAQQRAALTPELAALLPVGALFPPGTTLAMDQTSWHQVDGYANAMGTVKVPGKTPQHVEIGFAQQASGAWLVTFEEAAP